MKKLFFCLLLFGLPFVANGAVLLDQLENNTVGSWNTGNAWFSATTSISGSFDNANIYVSSTNAVENLKISIRHYAGANCTAPVSIFDSNVATTTSDEMELLTFTWSSPVNVTSSDCYSLHQSNKTAQGIITKSATSTLRQDEFLCTQACSGQSNGSSLAVFLSSGSSDFIEVTFPANNSTTTDFANFFVDYSTIASQPSNIDNLTVRMSYGESLEQFVDFENVGSSNQGVTSKRVLKQTRLSPGSYTARASLILNGIFIATSTVVVFNVEAGEYSANFPSPFVAGQPTGTSSDFYIACSDDEGFVANSFCNMMVFLFVPSADSLDRFRGLTFNQKFPFAYFYDVQDVVGTLSVDDDKDKFPSITIDLSSSSIPFSVNIFSSTTILSLVSQSTVTLFRNLFLWSIWIFFAVYVFHRIKDIFQP